MKLNDKFFLRLIWIVTAVVLVVVIALKIVPPPTYKPSFIYMLPHIIGGINATCSVLLILSLIFIKRKNIQAHKITNVITFILSALFLVFYILFHLYEKDTKYGDIDHNGILSAAELASVGASRMIYFIILVTHNPGSSSTPIDSDQLFAWIQHADRTSPENSKMGLSGLALCGCYRGSGLSDDFSLLQFLAIHALFIFGEARQLKTGFYVLSVYLLIAENNEQAS